MGENNTTLDTFFHDQTDLDEALEAHLQYCESKAEILQAIHHLIEHRNLLHDAEIARLEAETTAALNHLQSLEGKHVLEEIRHFKDILNLHRRLIELNGSG